MNQARTADGGHKPGQSAPALSLASLIERLEKATGPDRELDVLIGYAIDLMGDDKHLSFRTSFDTCGMEMMLRMAESYQNIWRTELPRYTASIEAAMTLVPHDWRIYAIQEEYIVPRGNWFAGLDHRTAHHKYGSMIGKSSTPAIAICIAALKAHSVREPSDSTKESALLLSKSPAEGGEM